MLALIKGQWLQIETGSVAVAQFIADLATRSEVNCVSVKEYLAVRQDATVNQKCQLDQAVTVKLQAAVSLLAAPQSHFWYGRKAAGITHNWLVQFAKASAVPAALRAIAAQGEEHEQD
ncbi:MAG: hypothetical protein LKJ69_01795 [Lactobacillus sp.]|nr:hypothetical protein [Lactobacillus sp.]MCI2032117.1 hypothetical protein [Lactobacillus sp.]